MVNVTLWTEAGSPRTNKDGWILVCDSIWKDCVADEDREFKSAVGLIDVVMAGDNDGVSEPTRNDNRRSEC